MSTLSTTVFSEYEVRKMCVIFDGGDVGYINCTGSLSEEAEVQTVTKKCRGVTVKTRTRGTGSGTLSVSAHIPYELYHRMLGMDANDTALINGVYAYGRGTTHPVFAVTAYVLDEDDVEKYKAWPSCTVSSGPTRSVENGADEVAEVELELAFSPDDNNFGMYEALVADLDETVAALWLEAFDPATMLAATE